MRPFLSLSLLLLSTAPSLAHGNQVLRARPAPSMTAQSIEQRLDAIDRELARRAASDARASQPIIKVTQNTLGARFLRNRYLPVE